MSKLDIDKRNQVLRKYCPDLFEEEAPPMNGKLRDASGRPIDAMILVFDDDGRPTDAWMLANHVVRTVFSENDEVRAALLALRTAPPSDTIIFDESTIARQAGRCMLSEIMGALSTPLSRFRGMSQRQIAKELMRRSLSSKSGSQPPPTETISLDEFFDGNCDDCSIAPNLVGCGHPGIESFRMVLERIRALPSVLDVRIGVHEWPFPDEEDTWIAAENVFIWARGVESEEVSEWLAPLRIDGVFEPTSERLPIGGPQMEPGMRIFAATWD